MKYGDIEEEMFLEGIFIEKLNEKIRRKFFNGKKKTSKKLLVKI